MATYMKENWFGGISEDDALGDASQYLYSENIDVTSKSNYIQLTPKPTKYIYTGSVAPNALLEIKDRVTNASVVASFCNDGVIHIDSDTRAYSNARLGNLGTYPVFILGDYVYFVNSTGASTAFKLNRTTISDAISGTWSPTLAYKDLALNSNYEHTGVLVTANLAFIWLGSKISQFVHGASFDIVTEYDLTGGDEIVGITITGGYYKIYTESGKVHLWDGSSDLLNESGTSLGFAIKKVVQINGIDYVFTGGLEKGGLYYMNGLQPVPLFTTTYSDTLSQWKFNFITGQTAVSNYRGRLFFLEDKQTYFKISSYGKDLQRLPNAYSVINTYTSGGNRITGLLTSILVSGDYVYYGYNDGVNIGVDKISIRNIGNKQANGYIITNINDLQDLRKKQFTNLYLRVGNITSTQYIEVYRSVDGGSYTLAHTINVQPDDGVAKIPATLLQGAGGFRDYSLKFVFYTNSSTSPKLYNRYILEYETKGI